MYYESIVHKERKVSGPEEAATFIKEGKVLCYEALSWPVEDGTMFAVSDAHIDDTPFGETALILKQEDRFYKVESITVAWCDLAKTIKHFKRASEDADVLGETQLLIGEAPPTAKADFTCTCCGEWFTGIVVEQLKFHQDNGYGVCPECVKYYT